LKLKCDTLLSSCAFKLNLRQCNKEGGDISKFAGDELTAFLKKAGVTGLTKMKKEALLEKARAELAKP
jgi:hypothetical protein